MEWLEFNRWSSEVEQHFALSTARQPTAVPPRPDASRTESIEARARRLQTLLSEYPRTNPWGHPAAEC